MNASIHRVPRYAVFHVHLLALALFGCSATTVGVRPTVAPGGVGSDLPIRRRVALVIGNGRYESVARLPNAARDAQAIGEALHEAGFDEVVTRTDLGHDEMAGLVRRFIEGLGPQDLAVLYYAGHGVSIGANNYLLPVDFDLDFTGGLGEHLAVEAFSLEQLLNQVSARASTNVLLFDACRNNPWASQVPGVGSRRATRRGVGRGLQIVAAPRGSLVAFATAPGTVAADGDGEHSPFAAALLGRLQEPVDVERMLADVTADVEDATQRTQTPWRQSSLRAPVVLTTRTPPAPAERRSRWAIQGQFGWAPVEVRAIRGQPAYTALGAGVGATFDVLGDRQSTWALSLGAFARFASVSGNDYTAPVRVLIGDLGLGVHLRLAWPPRVAGVRFVAEGSAQAALDYVSGSGPIGSYDARLPIRGVGVSATSDLALGIAFQRFQILLGTSLQYIFVNAAGESNNGERPDLELYSAPLGPYFLRLSFFP